jgi:hypothetical protein
MPLKVKKVTIPTIAASVLFNGSNQYLSVANNAAFDFGVGDFTVECWFYYTSTPPASAGYDYLWGLGGNNTNGLGLYIQGGVPKIWNGSSILSTSATILGTTWYHIVVVKNSSTLTVYLNGTSIGSVAFSSNLSGGGVSGFNIARWINTGDGEQFPGYISNLRILKGTALYTSNFTPSTSPLTAIANTSLLTCNAATIVDNSTNNFAITNNNTATVSSTITPFIAASPGSMKFKKTSTSRIGRSVLFNGTNQYLSVPSNAAFDFGTGSFTVECWVYAYSFGSYNGVVGQWTADGGNVANSFVLEAVGGDLEFFFSVGATLYGPIQGATLTLNTWQHVAAVRSGNTMYIFVDGVMYGSGTSVTQTFNNVASSLTVGGNIAGAGMWNGFISNLRILKGTALYTSNFTPSTAPLTAIANTSLLACNSATIVDNSTNNFAITNNNTATVSSTNPFGADTVSGTFKVKKSPAVYMTATGGDLITTSGSYKIHTFTTVGTSSFTISSVGSTPSIEYLIVGGGGAGGSNNNCGGGGAGGLIYNTASLSAGAYAVTIGQSGSVASGVSNGNNGGDSTFNGLIALGGGGGGGSTAGSNGGSGGGNGGGGFSGTGTVSAIGLQPTSSYGGFGNNGGASAGASSYPGGGGGGAGAAGNNGSGANGGNGGIGKAYAFAGALTYYAGGGGGSLNPGTPGTGGLGGGGNGVSSNPSAGANATGYGSGGGGGLSAGSGGVGGAGSPGIILIKYRYTD